MARNIFTVNATQVVISTSHPEGVKSPVQGYPVDYDSRSYNETVENPNGSEELALICAMADYTDRIKQLATANTPSRVMWTVTLESADGRSIQRKSWGAFPDMTPEQAE